MATDKQARVTANFGSTLDPQHPLGRLVTFHEKSLTDGYRPRGCCGSNVDPKFAVARASFLPKTKWRSENMPRFETGATNVWDSFSGSGFFTYHSNAGVDASSSKGAQPLNCAPSSTIQTREISRNFL